MFRHEVTYQAVIDDVGWGQSSGYGLGVFMSLNEKNKFMYAKWSWLILPVLNIDFL